QVNCVHIDVNGRLWAGTMEGLCLYDAASDSFRRIVLDAEVGEINGIIEDQGSLWLATTHGIVKYTPGRPLQLFNKFDGLVSEQFLPNACLKASDGRIFFGGVKGFNTFYPYLIKTNDVAPPVFITALEIFNHRQEVGGELLPEALHHIGEVNLSYRDDMFSLSFASLSYCSPEKNQYAYMLEGFDKDWNYVGSQHTATYTNIP
ncbi:triple tyrosine motif-containing protein, partial [Segatella buccae]|uniref:triple tyrosine motif-containing protein n=1 Tax=Segatella buccae TaxID=28126 RepID=UPI00066148B2